MNQTARRHRRFRATSSTTAVRDGFAAVLTERASGHCSPAYLHDDDQNFPLAASPWELTYCHPLKQKNAHPFIPLLAPTLDLSPVRCQDGVRGGQIRQGWTPAPTIEAEIVGYVGWTMGRNIWTQDGQDHRNGNTGNYELPPEWKPGDRLPVTAQYGRTTSQQRANGWAPFTEFAAFSVVCSIRGEILGIVDRESGNNGQAIPSSVHAPNPDDPDSHAAQGPSRARLEKRAVITP
jgi:hypothetical protein